MLLGCIYSFRPHPVVFGIGFSLVVGNGEGHQTDGGDLVSNVKHQSVVSLFSIFVTLLNSNVPLLLQVTNQLLLVPTSLG